MADQNYFEDVSVGDAIPALSVTVDQTQMFFFSAATYNGHRIHYDRDYVTRIEGYPDLVIHGPLLALLALELPRLRVPGQAVGAFEYRLVRPAFAPATVVAVGQPARDGIVELTVAAVGAEPSLTARAVLE